MTRKDQLLLASGLLPFLPLFESKPTFSPLIYSVFVALYFAKTKQNSGVTILKGKLSKAHFALVFILASAAAFLIYKAETSPPLTISNLEKLFQPAALIGRTLIVAAQIPLIISLYELCQKRLWYLFLVCGLAGPEPLMVSGAVAMLALALASEANINKANITEANINEANIKEAKISEATASESQDKSDKAEDTSAVMRRAVLTLTLLFAGRTIQTLVKLCFGGG
ncbi:MAG: hypothetical protein LCH63_04745 [Candidatus Melainabacteria bacterium]|nr:hypothetical protein [Candidatus Melainabacteria bacterium]OPZ85995.1 MAG: hypothetical protein BWY75_02275 [bacterium ADurb.Bin425]